ncbi:MAG: sulfite exporter TauE/SafE family protein [Gammaproteobacteria bacterium]|nr:sulfite exporter TauE/SafE family protein [Gammaproteobacteria bacterium]
MNPLFAKAIGAMLGLAFVLLCFALLYFEFQWQQIGFFLVGVTGAIFANSTGAGGGVVFIPLFDFLGFSEPQSLATSFGIQSYGMTAGAITWWCHYKIQTSAVPHPTTQAEWQPLPTLIAIAALASVAGIWLNFSLVLASPAGLLDTFRVFSIFLGICILTTARRMRGDSVRTEIEGIDYGVVALLAFGGGVITAWLSVGVGEIVAFYLIFRRYNTTLAIAVAVIVTAVTVWSVAPINFGANSQIYWQLVAFAGPGAVVGGITARVLVNSMSPIGLKIFFGVWLLFVGIVG